ncbi:hypothetical protein [Phyllobacterium endophyticum]|nr:hypothetical protein [Phyllobacterium endophyticum]MBB3234337.1 hypothetical protein [Phyllobacterium endophyticum]TYR44072.1 hypothetical protein FY050_02580 [Phyllobacterium endophyticum]
MAKSTQKSPETDAKGQFAKTQHGGDNDGVSSANPRVLSGKKDGDATFKSDAKENKKDRQAPSKPNVRSD